MHEEAIATQRLPDLALITLPCVVDEREQQLKPGGCSIFCAQFIAIRTKALNYKCQVWPLLLLPFTATVIFSLTVSFIWFQLDWAPTSAEAIYRVITLHSLFFTSLANTGQFTVFSRDRHEHLPCAMGPEVKQHFSAISVWVGRFTAETPFRLLLVVVSCAIIYPIVSLRPGFNHFLLYQTTLVLQSVANGAFGMLVSAVFKSATLGVWGGIFINTFNYVFSGVPYSPDRIWWGLRWLRYLSVSYYVDQILVVNQFVGATFPGYIITGTEIVEAKGWLSTLPYISIPMLVVLGLLWNFLGIIALSLSSRAIKY